MNLFNNSQNVVIERSTLNFNLNQHDASSAFTRFRGTITNGAMHNSGECFDPPIQHDASSAFAQLRGTIADGAMYDSSERFDPPTCYPGTRTAILENLLDWIIANDREAFMRWLFGPAGAGKSSILQKLAELCAKRDLLIASFFFSRTATLRNDEKRLITTIAYQLAQSIPETRPYIEAAIDHDPAFFSKSLESQLQSLVVKPLNQAYASVGKKRVRWPHLLVIDGLDECGSPAVQKHILTCLLNSAADCKFPILFLVSSRPETHLVLTFNQDVFKQGCVRTTLDNDDHQSEDDIRLFLNGTFRDIKANHPLRGYLPPNWPSRTIVNALVRKSSRQFIYPATVARFISPPNSHPAQCLDVVLGISALDSIHETPFAELDALYSRILSSLPNKEVSSGILALLTFPGRQTRWTPQRIDGFLGLRPGSAEQIVNELASIVMLDKYKRIEILHASLPDFLHDEKRSQQYYIDLPEAAAYFVKHCLKHFISGTDETASRDARRRLGHYYKQALPTQEFRENFLCWDLPAIARGKWRQELILRKEHVAGLQHFRIREDPFLGIIRKYLYPSRRIKFADVDIFVTQCRQVVEDFLESQVHLYRSTSPTLLMLLVLYFVEPELLKATPLNLHDTVYSPCSWVDILLAPAQRHEFERSVVVDDTSLRLRSLYWTPDPSITSQESGQVYIEFLQQHLSADDFAMTATRLATFITDVSPPSTWSSITKADRRRASVVGWDMDVAVTTISKRDFDNSILTLKHKAYERALRYLPLLLENASPDSALSDVLRRTTVMVPDISQWNHHTSTTVSRPDTCQIVSKPNRKSRVNAKANRLVAQYVKTEQEVEESIDSYLLAALDLRVADPENLEKNRTGKAKKERFWDAIGGVCLDEAVLQNENLNVEDIDLQLEWHRQVKDLGRHVPRKKNLRRKAEKFEALIEAVRRYNDSGMALPSETGTDEGDLTETEEESSFYTDSD